MSGLIRQLHQQLTDWRRLLLLAGAVSLLSACPPPAFDVYGWKPTAPALPATATGHPIDLVDISQDPKATFEDARKSLDPNEVLGTFTALNREGTGKAPLIPTIEDFARGKGGDAVILSCGEKALEGRLLGICSGMVLKFLSE